MTEAEARVSAEQALELYDAYPVTSSAAACVMALRALLAALRSEPSEPESQALLARAVELVDEVGSLRRVLGELQLASVLEELKLPPSERDAEAGAELHPLHIAAHARLNELLAELHELRMAP